MIIDEIASIVKCRHLEKMIRTKNKAARTSKARKSEEDSRPKKGVRKTMEFYVFVWFYLGSTIIVVSRTRIALQLCGLRYFTNPFISCQTAKYQLKGSASVTSRRIQYAQWDSR